MPLASSFLQNAAPPQQTSLPFLTATKSASQTSFYERSPFWTRHPTLVWCVNPLLSNSNQLQLDHTFPIQSKNPFASILPLVFWGSYTLRLSLGVWRVLLSLHTTSYSTPTLAPNPNPIGRPQEVCVLITMMLQKLGIKRLSPCLGSWGFLLGSPLTGDVD